uniref:ATP-binding cassette domain-containing protein n=1 Tax=Marinobacter sp. TaxID=50741 RepID=UPI0035637580
MNSMNATVNISEKVARRVIEDKPENAIITEGVTVGQPFSDDPKFKLRNVEVFYGDSPAIKNISLDIGRNEVIAFIGPSGCGKSTFLRC